MTADEDHSTLSVLNTTVLSNFAAVDQVSLLAALVGICAVPAVHEEIEAGVETHPHLRPALNALGESIPVASISDQVATRESEVRRALDPGEAQAFALAETQDGRLLTDDGDARAFAREHGVPVVGSVGVLLAAIDDGRITEPTAQEWLSTWIDEHGYRVPYRQISEYR